MRHRSLSLRHAVAATLAVACVAASGVASAADDDVMGEIIVTAQKREQSLQDVPVVVTAISEQLLHDTGVKDIKELTVLTPGLIVTSTSSEASTTARIRGVGTVGDNPGLESSVGVVIDGVYRPRNGVGFGDLGEMERIEVLKGPQGTLFGKNTSAGVINVVSKKPTFDPTAVFEVGGGNYGAFDVSSSINGPIASDKVAGRLFAAVRNRDGFLDVTNAGGDRPATDADRDFYTIRGQLLFNFSDEINLRLIGDISERDEQCCAAVQVVNGASAQARVAQVAYDGIGTAPVANPFARLAFANRPYGQQIKDRGLSAELTWDIDDTTLTSISSGRDWRIIRGQDTDYTTADIWYRNADGNVATEFRQLSEEIRLAGKSGIVNWLGGVFYAKEKLDVKDQLLYGVSRAASGTPSGFEGYLGRTLSGGASDAVLSLWLGMAPGTLYPANQGLKDAYLQTAESFAVFTNNDIELTDGLELTIGARYTAETKDLSSQYTNGGPTSVGSVACQRIRANIVSQVTGNPLPAGNVAIPSAAWAGALGYGCGTWADPGFNFLQTRQSFDESETTGTLKLAYRPNDALMAYASYARGYKASGFNLDRERQVDTAWAAAVQASGAAQLPDVNTSFPAEFVDSYEVGTKTTWMDGALLFNASVFQQIYKDFQLNTFLGTSFVVTSVKEVQSKGIDADVIIRTPFGLGIQGGVTLAETEVKEFGAAASVVRSDRLNDRLGFAPKVSGSLALTYGTEIGGFAVNGNIGAKYNSSYNTGSNLDPRKLQDAYTLVNARLGFGKADKSWTVELWGQNLTDEEYLQVAFDAPLQGSSSSAVPLNNAGISTIDAFLGTPRLYGLSFIVKFE